MQAAAAARRALAGIALRPRSASEASARAPPLPFLASGSSGTPSGTPRSVALGPASSGSWGAASLGSASLGSRQRLAGTFSAGCSGMGLGERCLAGSLPAGGGLGFGAGSVEGFVAGPGARGEAAARAAVLARSASEAGPCAGGGAGEAALGGSQEIAEGVRLSSIPPACQA